VHLRGNRAPIDDEGQKKERGADLNRGGVVAAGKLLFLRLDARHDRERQQIFVDASIKIQDLVDLLLGLGQPRKRRVA
jgi:hypothetical protein